MELNGVEHWYRVASAGRRTVPIVVIHGGPGGHVYTFERTIGPALETFATVVYYEQRGCGRSGLPEDPTAYSIPALVSDLEALRRELGLDKIIPLGFSFGGELALEYCLAHPKRVVRLVLQAPSVPTAGFFLRDERIAIVQLFGFRMSARGATADKVRAILAEDAPAEERLAEVWTSVDTETVDRFLFHDQDVACMNRHLWEEFARMLATKGTAQQEMIAALAANPPRIPLFDRLHLIEAPALVVVGLYDRNIGVESCRDVASLIPNARLEVFEHSAHFPDMEEPDKYAETVRKFLAQ